MATGMRATESTTRTVGAGTRTMLMGMMMDMPQDNLRRQRRLNLVFPLRRTTMILPHLQLPRPNARLATDSRLQVYSISKSASGKTTIVVIGDFYIATRLSRYALSL